MGQTPGSPSPTYLAGSRSPFQPSYQGQQRQQNNSTKGQRDKQSQARGPRDIQPQPSCQGQQVQQNHSNVSQRDTQSQARVPRDIQPQPSYQGQQVQQNYIGRGQKNTQSQARNQRDTQPQYQAQEPYHPPYERQNLVQQVRQQQQQSFQSNSYEGEVQQQYINQGRQTPYQQDIEQNQGVAQQGFQHQQHYGQQQSYHGQAQTMPQNTPQGDFYSNPKTIFFHMLFKGSAIIFYIFGGWITSSFVLQFVVIVLLAAFDFWTVKNVSGRILVGMRYWNENDENGRSIWRFESLDRQKTFLDNYVDFQSLDQLNNKDTTLFWTSLYATPAIWTLFGIVAALKFNFDYLMIVIIALTMSASNIIGFTKCKKDAKKKVQSFAHQAMGGFMRDAMTASITNNISKVFNVL